eukprot:scaffold95676_cov40-Phaeocystis_antarctica.AAC.1
MPSPGMPGAPRIPDRCSPTHPRRSQRSAAPASVCTMYGIVRCCRSRHCGSGRASPVAAASPAAANSPADASPAAAASPATAATAPPLPQRCVHSRVSPEASSSMPG